MGAHGTALKKEKFLKVYAEVANVSQACRLTGIPRNTVKWWQKHDKKFLAGYELAQEEGVEQLEQEARRRALKGVEQPVYQMGHKVGTIQKYSDVLLIFLLNAANPEKYRGRTDGAGTTPHADREETLNEIHRKLARLAPAGPAPEVPQGPDR